MVGVAAGIQQVVVVPYAVEIVPNRTRGGLVTLRSIWSSFGSILCSVMLQVANQKFPTFYRLPLYVCWGLSALMLVGILLVPESPWFYARHGRKADAMKSLGRLYGGIEGFSAEEEYGIIEMTLVLERGRARPSKSHCVERAFLRCQQVADSHFDQSSCGSHTWWSLSGQHL